MDSKKQREMYPGMWSYPTNPDRRCIYRVPDRLREVNPEAYTPKLVLIGPLHHSLKSQALKALDVGDDITCTKSMGYLNMEELKKTYLAEFAETFGGEKTIDGFKRMIEEEEEKIRESYSESTAWIQSPEFVEMVLHDSVFIIALLLRTAGEEAKKKGDPLLTMISLGNTVAHDLILLENQLPFFILEKLFDPIVQRLWLLQIWPWQTFRELIIVFFGFQGKIGNSIFEHFTDLYRLVRVETLPRHDQKHEPIGHMYNADKLDTGGVNFIAVEEEWSLNVRFENGCLKMPRLKVVDSFELILRNIMALEQCHYPDHAHVCSYILFLDRLIDTDKDVDLLVEKGIIENRIGQPASVARMVNKLGLGLVTVASYCSDIAVEVNAYYTNPVNKSKAVLKRVYFGNLWTGTATIATTFLLVMTLIQTVTSIIQAMHSKS